MTPPNRDDKKRERLMSQSRTYITTLIASLCVATGSVMAGLPTGEDDGRDAWPAEHIPVDLTPEVLPHWPVTHWPITDGAIMESDRPDEDDDEDRPDEAVWTPDVDFSVDIVLPKTRSELDSPSLIFTSPDEGVRAIDESLLLDVFDGTGGRSVIAQSNVPAPGGLGLLALALLGQRRKRRP